MSLHHLSFAWPWSLLTLLLVPAFLAFTWAIARRRSRYTVAFTNLPTLASVVVARGDVRRFVPVVLLALALATASAALARPRVNLSHTDRGATVLLLADVSGSMAATDVRPTRLFAAIRAMHDLIDRLPAGDKVGLVAFSDDVQVISPPTTDHAAVESALTTLTPEGGTALGDAVEASVRIIISSLSTSGVHYAPGKLPAAIVLETDGSQDRGTVSPSQAAQLASDAGVRIYGIALGTRQGFVTTGTGLLTNSVRAVPDPSTVALLARETGGRAFSAHSASRLNTIYRQLGSSVGRVDGATEITGWFELAAAVLLLLGIAAARIRGGALP